MQFEDRAYKKKSKLVGDEILGLNRKTIKEFRKQQRQHSDGLLKHHTIQHLIINVIIKSENNAETHNVNLRNTLEQSSDLHLRNVIVSVIVT